MRNSGGEVPEVAFRYASDKALAIQVNCGDAGVSVQHERSLRLGVPVQLAYASCGQSHVHAGDCFGNGKLANRDLARPSTLLHAFVREREGILERLYAARVGGWRQVRVGILSVARGIGWTGSTRTAIRFGWIRALLLGEGVGRRHQPSSRQCRRSHTQKSAPRMHVLVRVVAHESFLRIELLPEFEGTRIRLEGAALVAIIITRGES